MTTTTAAGGLLRYRDGFRFVTKSIVADMPGEGEQGPRRFHTIASSTIKDIGNDEMLMSAMEDMRDQFRAGVPMFMNHSYNLPEDSFGVSDWAEIRDSGVRDDQGNQIWDLHVAGVVDESNPRAIQLHSAIINGMKWGASVGAIVERKSMRRNADGGKVIAHLTTKEASIVGIAQNQRSWVQKAVAAVTGLDPDDEPEDEEETVGAVAESAISPVELDTKGDMSAKTRGALPDSEFACPEKRKYPINDKAHIRAALSRIADPSNDQCGRDKILAAARREGIGDHEKALPDDMLLTWALGRFDDEGEEVAKALPATCPGCDHSFQCDCASCACDNAGHASSTGDTDHDGDDPAHGFDPDSDGKGGEKLLDPQAILDLVVKADTDTAAGGQEADAATPETTPEDEDEDADPAIEQKAFTFEPDDVVALVKKAKDLVTVVGERDERIASLTATLAEKDAELARHADLVKSLRDQFVEVAAMPLRPRAVAIVKSASDALDRNFYPEVAETLTKMLKEKDA